MKKMTCCAILNYYPGQAGNYNTLPCTMAGTEFHGSKTNTETFLLNISQEYTETIKSARRKRRVLQKTK